MASDLRDQTVSDLVDILKDMQRASRARDTNNNTDALKTNTSTMNEVVDAIEKSTTHIILAFKGYKALADYNKHLKRKKVKEDKELEEIEKNRKKALENDTKAQKRHQSSIEKFTQSFLRENKNRLEHIKSNEELIDYYRNVQRRYATASDEEVEAIKRHIRWKHLELEQERKNAHWTNRIFGKDMRYASDNLKMWVYQLSTSITPWALFVKGLKGLNQELNKSAEVGLPAFSHGLMTFVDVFKTGMTVTELLDFKKQYVMAGSAAIGGLNGFVETVNKGALDAMSDGLVANQKEWAQLNGALYNAVQTTGTKFEDAAKRKGPIDSLMTSFKSLHKSVAMSSAEFIEMTEAVSKDADHRNIMLRLSAKERAMYVADTVAIQEHLMTSKKVSKEQAQAMTDFVKKMQGETYKDRLKRSLKTQLTAGLLGVGGGEEAARIIRKGGRATKQEKQDLIDFQDRMSRAAEGRRGMGGVQELFIDTLNEKTNGIISESATMNSTLSENLEVNKETKGKIEQVATNINSLFEYISKGAGALLQTGMLALLGSISIGVWRLVSSDSLSLMGKGSKKGKNVLAEEMDDFVGPRRRQKAQWGSKLFNLVKDGFSTVKNYFTKPMNLSSLAGSGGMMTRLISMSLPLIMTAVVGYTAFKAGSALYDSFIKEHVVSAAQDDYYDADQVAKRKAEDEEIQRQLAQAKQIEAARLAKQGNPAQKVVAVQETTRQKLEEENSKREDEERKYKNENDRSREMILALQEQNKLLKEALETLKKNNEFNELTADSTQKTMKYLRDQRGKV